MNDVPFFGTPSPQRIVVFTKAGQIVIDYVNYMIDK